MFKLIKSNLECTRYNLGQMFTVKRCYKMILKLNYIKNKNVGLVGLKKIK